jgi:hypothetical protein
MRRVALALRLGLCIAGDEDGVEGVLMIIIVGQRGMDVRRRQVGIRLNEVRRTVAMHHVIGDEVDHPMAGAVEARDPAGFRVRWGSRMSSGLGVFLPVSAAHGGLPRQARPSRSPLRPPGRWR